MNLRGIALLGFCFLAAALACGPDKPANHPSDAESSSDADAGAFRTPAPACWADPDCVVHGTTCVRDDPKKPGVCLAWHLEDERTRPKPFP